MDASRRTPSHRQNAICTANAVGSATWSVMLALGAAIGGLVSGAFGVYTAFAIDSITFIVSALIIARLRYEISQEVMRARSTSIFQFHKQYLDGNSGWIEKA